MFGIVWNILFLFVLVYSVLGVNFAVRAAINQKATGKDLDWGALLAIGVFWLPLFISDPKDFTSVEVLHIRTERRDQKNYERKMNLASAQATTIEKQVATERQRAELEALRTKSVAEVDRHRQNAEQFINARHTRELAATEDGDVVEAEVVIDKRTYRQLPLRYNSLRSEGGQEEVWDMTDGKWVPKWAMVDGYRWEQFG